MLTSIFSPFLLLLAAPLALSQCVPSPAPYTSEQYEITTYYETLSSQRPPDIYASIFGFTFYDPNTCFGPIECVHEWKRGLGEPGPRDGWWPCSPEHPEVQALHVAGEYGRNGSLQVKYNYQSVDSYGWGGVPSYLDVVEEEDWTESA
ncbi:hypothetical protein BJ508DRAFT_310526 [Ascobolus immersus RN42]|uniref:AA1-like domain-containing protein n=1 Tax=Ascobolus immersus RN42 TaxID=1160509 RepID=A0A3N4I586_ASCIM|nr:hypothetical protein BJ508DRAFT_310526 [Ascobolus immersus RN42]